MTSSSVPGSTIFHQDGILLGASDIALANAFNNDPDGSTSRLALRDAGTWMSFDVETDRLVSLAATSRTLFAMGREGLILRVELPLPPDRPSVLQRISMFVISDVHRTGELVRCRAVGDVAFAVGQCGQVYRLTEQRFEKFSLGLRADDSPDFEDVGGVDESLLYACGIGGAVFRFNGARWDSLDAPTDANLSGVLVESARSVYFCGDGGLLLHLLDGRWHVHEGPTDRNYWDVCSFRGAPVLAHSSGIDSFDGHNIRPLDAQPPSDNTFNRLHAVDGRLLSTGPDDLFLIEAGVVQAIAVPGRP
jgi:hypothetical protein